MMPFSSVTYDTRRNRLNKAEVKRQNNYPSSPTTSNLYIMILPWKSVEEEKHSLSLFTVSGWAKRRTCSEPISSRGHWATSSQEADSSLPTSTTVSCEPQKPPWNWAMIAVTVTGSFHRRATHWGDPWSLFQHVSGEPSKRCCFPSSREFLPRTELTLQSASPTLDTSAILKNQNDALDAFNCFMESEAERERVRERVGKVQQQQQQHRSVECLSSQCLHGHRKRRLLQTGIAF